MVTDPPQGSVRAEGAYGTAALPEAEDAAEDPVATITAAARRAWGALLCYYLRVALATRERSEPCRRC